MIGRRRTIAGALAPILAGLVAAVPAGAASADAPTCAGKAATIVGTTGADTLTGTPGRDVIVAGAGNDTIVGLEGADIICAGPGRDTIEAGPGGDRVLAGRGDDRVDSGAGADTVRGGSGDDDLWGRGGDDRLLGNDGDDTIHAGHGDDVSFAHAGDDHVLGNDGDDTLRGGPGNDTIGGGTGKDLVVGSAGSDLIRGGTDHDFLRAGGGDDTLRGDTGEDVLQAGMGDDSLWGGPGADYLDGGRGIDHCGDAAALDSAVCEDAEPPPGTFGCLPDGQASPYHDGVIGSAAASRSGPRGPAVLIGDSLTSGIPGPLAGRLAQIGYGPICIDGVGSRSVHRAPTGHTGGIDAIARVRAAHPIWSSDATWIVALGTNDSRFWTELEADVAGEEVAVTLDAIGASGRDLWWINVRTTQPEWRSNEDAWNDGVASHARLGVIDWAAIATNRPKWFFDGIHPTAAGHRRRLNLIAATLTADD
ncbi:MAG: hypothetical protein OEW42_15850 [Acidimicrobiia bacterium]|nr:hypothetical protein [Acidimicrobiia bacterium]